MSQRFFSLNFLFIYTLHQCHALLLLCALRVTLWIFDSGVADPRPFLQLNSDGPSLQTASEYTGYLELDNLFTPGVSEGWFCARAHTHRHTHAHTHSSHTHIPHTHILHTHIPHTHIPHTHTFLTHTHSRPEALEKIDIVENHM